MSKIFGNLLHQLVGFVVNGAHHVDMGDRHRFQPKGLFGGRPGALARTVLNPDREAEELQSKEVRRLRRGDVLSIQLSGGGGFGEPAKRDPQAVRDDVADDFISVQAAREAYGVEIDEK